MSDFKNDPERNHLVSVLRGKVAHKTGVEKEEAYKAYFIAKYGQEPGAVKYGTPKLPITSRLRCHCATRAY